MTDNLSGGVHQESEDYDWTIDVGDHPERSDSPEYGASRAAMIKIVQATQPWFFGGPPYQDHHGGGIWVKDETGWLLLLGLAGIEWSAQFCADPAKVDVLRQHAQRLCAGFPATITGYEEARLHRGRGPAEYADRDAGDIARWTDGIFNACVPLPATLHTGVLMAGIRISPLPEADHRHHDVQARRLHVVRRGHQRRGGRGRPGGAAAAAGTRTSRCCGPLQCADQPRGEQAASNGKSARARAGSSTREGRVQEPDAAPIPGRIAALPPRARTLIFRRR